MAEDSFESSLDFDDESSEEEEEKDKQPAALVGARAATMRPPVARYPSQCARADERDRGSGGIDSVREGAVGNSDSLLDFDDAQTPTLLRPEDGDQLLNFDDDLAGSDMDEEDAEGNSFSIARGSRSSRRSSAVSPMSRSEIASRRRRSRQLSQQSARHELPPTTPTLIPVAGSRRASKQLREVGRDSEAELPTLPPSWPPSGEAIAAAVALKPPSPASAAATIAQQQQQQQLEEEEVRQRARLALAEQEGWQRIDNVEFPSAAGELVLRVARRAAALEHVAEAFARRAIAALFLCEGAHLLGALRCVLTAQRARAALHAWHAAAVQLTLAEQCERAVIAAEAAEGHNAALRWLAAELARAQLLHRSLECALAERREIITDCDREAKLLCLAHSIAVDSINAGRLLWQEQERARDLLRCEGEEHWLRVAGVCADERGCWLALRRRVALAETHQRFRFALVAEEARTRGVLRASQELLAAETLARAAARRREAAMTVLLLGEDREALQRSFVTTCEGAARRALLSARGAISERWAFFLHEAQRREEAWVRCSAVLYLSAHTEAVAAAFAAKAATFLRSGASLAARLPSFLTVIRTALAAEEDTRRHVGDSLLRAAAAAARWLVSERCARLAVLAVEAVLRTEVEARRSTELEAAFTHQLEEAAAQVVRLELSECNARAALMRQENTVAFPEISARFALQAEWIREVVDAACGAFHARRQQLAASRGALESLQLQQQFARDELGHKQEMMRAELLHASIYAAAFVELLQREKALRAETAACASNEAFATAARHRRILEVATDETTARRVCERLEHAAWLAEVAHPRALALVVVSEATQRVAVETDAEGREWCAMVAREAQEMHHLRAIAAKEVIEKEQLLKQQEQQKEEEEEEGKRRLDVESDERCSRFACVFEPWLRETGVERDEAAARRRIVAVSRLCKESTTARDAWRLAEAEERAALAIDAEREGHRVVQVIAAAAAAADAQNALRQCVSQEAATRATVEAAIASAFRDEWVRSVVLWCGGHFASLRAAEARELMELAAVEAMAREAALARQLLALHRGEFCRRRKMVAFLRSELTSRATVEASEGTEREGLGELRTSDLAARLLDRAKRHQRSLLLAAAEEEEHATRQVIATLEEPIARMFLDLCSFVVPLFWMSVLAQHVEEPRARTAVELEEAESRANGIAGAARAHQEANFRSARRALEAAEEAARGALAEAEVDMRRTCAADRSGQLARVADDAARKLQILRGALRGVEESEEQDRVDMSSAEERARRSIRGQAAEGAAAVADDRNRGTEAEQRQARDAAGRFLVLHCWAPSISSIARGERQGRRGIAAEEHDCIHLLNAQFTFSKRLAQNTCARRTARAAASQLVALVLEEEASRRVLFETAIASFEQNVRGAERVARARAEALERGVAKQRALVFCENACRENVEAAEVREALAMRSGFLIELRNNAHIELMRDIETQRVRDALARAMCAAEAAVRAREIAEHFSIANLERREERTRVRVEHAWASLTGSHACVAQLLALQCGEEAARRSLRNRELRGLAAALDGASRVRIGPVEMHRHPTPPLPIVRAAATGGGGGGGGRGVRCSPPHRPSPPPQMPLSPSVRRPRGLQQHSSRASVLPALEPGLFTTACVSDSCPHRPPPPRRPPPSSSVFSTPSPSCCSAGHFGALEAAQLAATAAARALDELYMEEVRERDRQCVTQQQQVSTLMRAEEEEEEAPWSRQRNPKEEEKVEQEEKLRRATLAAASWSSQPSTSLPSATTTAHRGQRLHRRHHQQQQQQQQRPQQLRFSAMLAAFDDAVKLPAGGAADGGGVGPGAPHLKLPLARARGAATGRPPETSAAAGASLPMRMPTSDAERTGIREGRMVGNGGPVIGPDVNSE